MIAPRSALAALFAASLIACDAGEAPSAPATFGAALAEDAPLPPLFEQIGAPLPFVPFTLRELQEGLGRPLRPETPIRLPDGSRRTVREALTILNAAEADVAAGGSTLRGGLAALGSPLPAELGEGLKEPVRYRALLDHAAAAESRDRYAQGDASRPIEDVELAGDQSDDEYAEWLEEQAPDGGIGEPLDPPVGPDCQDETVDVSDAWERSIGFPDMLEASLEASVRVSGDERAAVLSGSAFAGGKLFGASLAVFETRGRFVGPREGDGHGHVSLTLMGRTVVDHDLEPGTWHQAGYGDAVRKAVTIPIANLLGVVQVKARVGVEGSAGMRYAVATAKLFARGGLTPWAATSGFAKVFAGPKIDLGVVKAKLVVGVRGELTFLEDNLTISGSVVGREGECLDYSWYYKGLNALSALAGTLDLFAEAEGCVFRWCVGDRWTWRLFEWDGVGPIESVIFEGRE